MANNQPEVTIDGNISPLRQKLREASEDLKRFGASGGPAIDGLAGSVMKLTSRFTALGAVLSLGGLVAMARQSIDSADALNDLALRTQTSVHALASFKLISEQSGTNLDALGKGLNKLSVFMAENAEAAKKLGITARDPVQAFIQFANALGRAATPQDRAAIANKVLGKSFQDLLPLLGEGANNLRAAATASADYAQKLAALAPRADAFNDRLAVMSQRWDALKVSMGTALLNMLPNSMTMDATSARILQLKTDIGTLQRALDGSQGSGWLHKLMYGTKDEITAKLANAKKEMAALTAQQSQPASANQGGKIAFSDIEDAGKKGKKAKSTGNTMSDAEWAMEVMAWEARTASSLANERATAEEASYDRAVKAAEEWEADNERANEAVAASTRKSAEQRLQIELMRAEGVHNAVMARIDDLQTLAQMEADTGQITQAEYLTRLEQFNIARLASEQRYLDQKREVALKDPEQNPVEFERLEQERAEIRRRYASQGLEIQRQQALEANSIWTDLGDRMSGLWDKGMQALLNGTLTWRNGLRAIGAEVVSWFAMQVVGNQIKAWLAGHAKMLAVKLGFTAQEKAIQVAGSATTVGVKTAETTAVAGMNAVQAGTGAAASQASIPFAGPILALAAMAAVFAAVSALGKRKSAMGGYDIPRGLNPMVQTHEEEMILPQQYANVIRGLAKTGTNSGETAPAVQPITLHINAVDGQSVRRLFLDHGPALADALKAQVRGFRQ